MGDEGLFEDLIVAVLDHEAAGVVAVAVFEDAAVADAAYLHAFVVDEHFQRVPELRLGTRFGAALYDILARNGFQMLLTTTTTGPGASTAFWGRMGNEGLDLLEALRIVRARAGHGCFNVASTWVFSKQSPRGKHPRFEFVPRDDRSSKNEPNRVENDRDMSLQSWEFLTLFLPRSSSTHSRC